MNTTSFPTYLKTSMPFLCAAVFAGAVLFNSHAADQEAKKLQAAPSWELKDVDGKVVKSADFKGKIVLIDFWATWCPPCRAEIPGFVELQKKYGKQGLVIVGVSLDEEGPSVVKPFMKKFKINYPVVMGDEVTTKLFGGIQGIPTTFLVNQEGQIVSKHVGFVEKSKFEEEIKALLKNKLTQREPQPSGA